MGSKKDKWVDDIQFIFEECGRLCRILNEDGPQNISRHDSFYDMPHPQNLRDKMLCGRDAHIRVEDLAREAGRRERILGRIKLHTLTEICKEELVIRFLRQKNVITNKQVDRLLSKVARRAKGHCKDVVHFVPCHLMNSREPLRIVIGPIILHNRQSIRKLFREKLSRRNHEVDKYNNVTKSLLYRALRYYGTFRWVAEVPVNGCDGDTSMVIAEQATTSALDCLHLIFGVYATDRMRVGGPAVKRDHRASLWLTAEDTLEPSLSSSHAGQIGFTDGWSAQLINPDFKCWLELCATALEAAVDPGLDRPLSRRFLDAAQWFGEASRDVSPSTRVVKYVIALERMVMTEEKNDISRLVSERIAALCCESEEDRILLRQKATRLYDLRSKLVHGTISPRAQEVSQGIHIGVELGRRTLLCGLQAFNCIDLRIDHVSSKALGKWFGDILKFADRRCRSA